jgi:hypothetical protein
VSTPRCGWYAVANVVAVGWVLILEVVLVVLDLGLVGNPVLKWFVEVKVRGLQADEVDVQIWMRKVALLERPQINRRILFLRSRWARRKSTRCRWFVISRHARVRILVMTVRSIW